MSRGAAWGFEVIIRRLPEGIIVVEVAGKLDMDTAPILSRALNSVTNYTDVRLIVDVNGVKGTTIHVLIALVFGLRNIHAGAGGLVVVCNVERLIQLFRSPEMKDAFYIVPNLASARKLYADRTVFDHPAPSVAALKRLLQKGFKTAPPAATHIIDRLSPYHSASNSGPHTYMPQAPPPPPSPSTVRRTIAVAAIGLGSIAAAGVTWYWQRRHKR